MPFQTAHRTAKSHPLIKLSVALVTRNRPDWLRRCLGSWRTQSVQPYEIVISDDSGEDSRRMSMR